MHVFSFKSTTHNDDKWGNGGIAPRIIKFEHLIKTNSGFTTEPLFLSEKEPHLHFVEGAIIAPAPFWAERRGKELLTLPGIELRLLGSQISTLII